MSWTAVAARQAGLITRSQLLAAQVSARTVDNWSAAGRLDRTPTRGVYQVAGAARGADWPVWFAALSTDAPVTYLSAGRWWEVPVPDDGLVHVTTMERRRQRWPAGVRVHRVAIRPSDLTRHRGLLVTTRVETLLDCLGWISLGAARSLADRAVSCGWLRPADLARRLDEQPGRWGNRQLQRLQRGLGDGAAAESERVLHRLLRAHGITGWVPNLPVVADGRRWLIDVAFPHARLAIEIDGYAYHSDQLRFQHDRTRQNALIRAGWRVLRFTWADLIERPNKVIAEIVALLAA